MLWGAIKIAPIKGWCLLLMITNSNFTYQE